jgi:hypothetical protein
MRQQSYLVRKGARYHFRRRIRRSAQCHPITIALNTAEPGRARYLARRLAAKWDELDMDMDFAKLRGTLTLDEQEALFRKGLKEELAKATAHLTAPMSTENAHPLQHKILAAAYRIIARVPESATAIDRSIIDLVVPDDWTAHERELLDRVLILMVTPKSVSSSKAEEELGILCAPSNDATITEARAHLLRGYAEAQRRAEFATHPLVMAATGSVERLLDDAFVAKLASPASAAPQLVSDTSVGTGTASHDTPNIFFARTTSVKFSDQIDTLLRNMFKTNKWQDDKGRTRHMLEAFAWLTGDKKMSDYEPEDVNEFVRRMQNIPLQFKWGRLHKFGNMAVPFDEDKYPELDDTSKRSGRTINSYLTKLEAAADALKTTYWMPRQGYGRVISFAAARIKIVDDDVGEARVPLTEEALRALYSLPLWRGGGGHLKRLHLVESPIIYQDAAYWVPLLGTYAGLSREEACGIELADVHVDAEIPYISISANMTKSKDGKKPGGLKRASRRRALPLHSEILRLGFAKYVEAIRAEGHACLFPELYGKRRSGDTMEAWKKPGGSQFYARAWRGIIDATHAISPLPKTSNGKYADFHSQRTFHYSVMAAENVNETLLARHIGHSAKSTGGKNYNKRALALGLMRDLSERRAILDREVPIVTDGVPTPDRVNLLALNHRSRVGSAKGRNASTRFLA